MIPVQAENEAHNIVEIHGLPSGRYAIAIHHDLDMDGDLNKWLGFLPSEPYGFSNNVGKYGPASFNGAAIDLADDKEIEVSLHTPAVKSGGACAKH